FEDGGVPFLEPLTLTRPAWALWCGAASVLERQRRALAADELGALVRPELAELCRLQSPQMPINDVDFLRGDQLVLANGRWLPRPSLTIDLAEPHVGLVDGQVAYVARPPIDASEHWPEMAPSWLEHCRATLPACDVGGSLAAFLWDFIDQHADALAQ